MLFILSLFSLFIFTRSSFLGFTKELTGEVRAHIRFQVVLRVPYFNQDRFDLNLVKDDSNIVFHMSVRFGNKRTICNTRTNGWWGWEETKDNYFPFIIGKLYKIEIDIEENEFVVYVNELFFLRYNNRMKPLSNIKRFNIPDAYTYAFIVIPL